ncbi:MAG TPA: aldehyde ferredoxin oxidoreductase C-terminal domain-containing protein [Candidatus Limnocylindrales bacterium]
MAPGEDPGRVLRVDLSNRSVEVEVLDAETRRDYVGGSLLGTRLLLAETQAGLDAFDEAALLVLASSVVAGHRAAGLARFSVVAKSPLTGGIGESRAEGPFGIALKEAGFEAIAVRGRAGGPVILSITDGAATLVDAPELWGLDTSVVVDAIEARMGLCHVAAIGPAGERLVRFASIVSDRSFAAPRMGLGAVMGSKRLKAIAIAGGSAPPVADPDRLAAIDVRYAAELMRNPVTRWQHEPPGFGAWVGGATTGTFSVENYRTSRFPHAPGYAKPALLRQLAWSTGGCPGCPTDCIKGFGASAEEGAIGSARARREGGLHQEALAALGPNLGLGDVGDVLALNDLCLRLGLDPVSLGFAESFAMECRERGLATAADFDGADLRFGATGPARELIERIARREGAGDWLADGSRIASRHVGRESAFMALEVKGLEMTAFDPRAQSGLALGFAVAPFGPRYDFVEHDVDYDDRAPAWPHSLELSRALGVSRMIPATATSAEKVRNVAALAEFWSALDALVVCPFASAPVRILSLENVAGIVGAIAGWETSSQEVMAWGARRLQLMRIYNLREGLSADDDRLPDRFFEDPIDDGPLAGERLDRGAFAGMISAYYELMGWDADGIPTAATRRRHGLEWAAPKLEPEEP